MAKATKTLQYALSYQPHHAMWFAETQALYNRVLAFYFEVINAHEGLLELSTKDALTALERLTHRTADNPHPIMPLSDIADSLPAMVRRAAINAALGSARSFFTHLKKWKAKKAKAEAKGKVCKDRPPVPPRTWKKPVTFYAGMYKDRTASTILLKVWTGTCWSWLKVRTLGRELEDGFVLGSPTLIRKGERWWLHTPLEKTFISPVRVATQLLSPETSICSVDLNLDGHIAVCTVQTVEGTIRATHFLRGGSEISGFRKRQVGRIAQKRRRTGVIAEDEQDNAALWRKIGNRDEHFAHLVSRRIVNVAQLYGASLLVFEHLGNLQPEKGTYSKRGNAKRAYWMKGRIFQYAKYKAWNAGIITSRVNPRNTSRDCARCGAPIVRYCHGTPEEGYTTGAPLMMCPSCGKRDHADRNASIVIGQRLITRSTRQTRPQEKPPTPVA